MALPVRRRHGLYLMAAIALLTIPLALLLLLVLLGWIGIRLPGPVRRHTLLSLGALAAGLLLDAALEAALPRLGLSWGPVGLPLFLAFLLRTGLVLPSLLYLGLRRPPAQQLAALAVVTIALQASLLAVEIDGLYIEPFRLGVTRMEVSAPAFLPDRPLRILQISDLHVERTGPRERQMLADVASLQPDLIVLTGDYINEDYANDPTARQDARWVISQLHAPYGVYAIVGTIEMLYPDVMPALFTGLDVHVLDDRVQVVSFPGGQLALIGVTNTPRLESDRNTLAALERTAPAEAYSLLLYHTPDLVEAAAADGVDLELAGHTHGGQFRLPFYGALVTGSVFGKKYEMGRYQVGATTLYVSRGIGMEGMNLPRMRFLCPPELVLVELGK